MKDFFKELFTYHHHFNQQIIDLMLANRAEMPANSFVKVSHFLNAHHTWNARILGQAPAYAVWQEHEPTAWATLDLQNYEQSLSILDQTTDLLAVLDYKTSKGAPMHNTIRDILFHVINHTTHHRGQVVMQLRIAGIDPPMTDYIFYKR